MKLFRAFDIDFKADWSMLALIGLMVYGFSSIMMQKFQDTSNTLIVVSSVGLSLSVILSIVLHELGHVYVGRKFGVSFSSITIFLLGGVAKMDSSPQTPKAEAYMSLAGPLTSAGISLVLFFLLVWLRILGISVEGPVSYVFMSLVAINMIMAFFNMIPMFPTDGGRVLRAIAWRWTGSFLKATKIAVNTGKGFAYGFIVSGFLMSLGFDIPWFGTGIGSGLWLITVSFAIIMMGRAELKHAHLLASHDGKWK